MTDCDALLSSAMSEVTSGISAVIGCVAALAMLSANARIAVSWPERSALPPTAHRSARALPYPNMSMLRTL